MLNNVTGQADRPFRGAPRTRIPTLCLMNYLTNPMRRSSFLALAFVTICAFLTGCAAKSGPATAPLTPSGVTTAGRNPASPIPPPALAVGERAEFMRIHNQARASAGVPPLEWSQELASFAQEWANRLASRGQLEHRPGNLYGENLAYGTELRAAAAANLWLQERAAYDGGPIDSGNISAVGHYTQMIWRSTTRVGYGIARVGSNIYVVANYAPAGNVVGQRPR
jgi:uncharacterized protein YkwD